MYSREPLSKLTCLTIGFLCIFTEIGHATRNPSLTILSGHGGGWCNRSRDYHLCEFFFNCLSDCTYCSSNILQHLDRSPIPFLFISYKSSVHMFWANLNVLFCFSLTMKNHRRTRAPRSRPNLLQMKNPVSKQTRMRNYPSGELAGQSGSGLGHVTWKSDSGSSRERLEWRPRIHGSTSKESTRMVESLKGPCYSYVSMKYFKSLIIVDTTVKLFCILENKDLSFCKKIVSFLINYELQ